MNIIVNGAGGKMGRVLCALIKSGSEHKALALVDKAFETDAKQGVFKNIFECPEKADVIIDFSFHTAVPVLCPYAVKTKTPLVIATTGHTEKERSIILSAAKFSEAAPNTQGASLILRFTMKTINARS